MKTHYRGYDIVVNANDNWSAEIINANTGKPWSQRPSVPLDAGLDACIVRAQNYVDAHIALKGR